jgi:ketosteroid isomerase-like protein
MKGRLLFLLLTILFSLGCQISEEERVHQVLNRREEALRKKALSLYLSCISPNYQDKEENFGRIQSRIEGYFKTFESITYSSWDRSVRFDGETARVIQQFYLEVEKGGKKNRYSGKEALLLKKEGKEWKIIEGL